MYKHAGSGVGDAPVKGPPHGVAQNRLGMEGTLTIGRTRWGPVSRWLLLLHFKATSRGLLRWMSIQGEGRGGTRGLR
jgi:hypothetical protein